MAKITPKENFMRLRHGGTPAYVPFYSLMGDPYKGENAVASAMVPFFENTMFMDGGKDIWGVPYRAPENLAASMPDTSVITLEDISQWTKVLKFPKANDDLDLEKVYQDTLTRVDRTQSCLKVGPDLMPFQELVALMGFEGGLMALSEDPEEVSAMLNAMTDFMEPYYTRIFEVFKPDLWSMGDDTCAKMMPFFSPETYKEVFLPIYKRLAKPALENGVPVIFHNCGKEELFLDFMVEFGVEMTEPAQEVNDILMLKEKYKGKMTFIGCWGWGDHIPRDFPDFDEEAFRQDIRDTIDKYSVGGGYAFAGFPIGQKGEEEPARRAYLIMRDEVHTYGRKVYGYTDD
ncbi:MAG: hypothetical protein IKQ10_05195 [Oscillospiraceae bacterium]|nr:hypothetical protein [Oscillospiraceae bacterium]